VSGTEEAAVENATSSEEVIIDYGDIQFNRKISP
jgi:hypothetical protein